MEVHLLITFKKKNHNTLGQCASVITITTRKTLGWGFSFFHVSLHAADLMSVLCQCISYERQSHCGPEVTQ